MQRRKECAIYATKHLTIISALHRRALFYGQISTPIAPPFVCLMQPVSISRTE